MTDARVGFAELERLAEVLAPACRLGEYTLEGLISKTSTALVFVARGGVFGVDLGVMKLSGQQYAPLLERELGLLNVCQAAGVHGIIRPVQSTLVWFEPDSEASESVAALLLPFLAGGDLVQLIGAQVTRTGRLGPQLALEVGVVVASVLRDLLKLPQPMIHRDVKPQNVLLPYPGAPLRELTLIDLDASEELEGSLEDLATAPRDVAVRLVEDVHGLGELLFALATGREPPLDEEPDPLTGNRLFDGLVVKCLTSEADGLGYVCLADNGLWRDLEQALQAERAREQADRRWFGLANILLSRRSLAGVGGVLFLGLVAAIAAKVSVG